MRIALHEQHVVDVAGQIAKQHALAERQMPHIFAQMGAEDDKTQVHAEGRRQHHPHRGTGRDQRDGGQLCRTGKHQQRHQQAFEQAEAGVGHGHAGHQAPGGNAQPERPVGTRALPERRLAQHGEREHARLLHRVTRCRDAGQRLHSGGGGHGVSPARRKCCRPAGQNRAASRLPASACRRRAAVRSGTGQSAGPWAAARRRHAARNQAL